MGQDVIRTVGDQVPPFALYDQNGKVLTSEFFDGSTTVMNFIFTREDEVHHRCRPIKKFTR